MEQIVAFLQAYWGYLLVGFGLLLAWTIIKAAANQRRKVQQLMQQLGFFEVTPPDKQLKERIQDLISTGKEKEVIGRVFRYSSGNADFFIFNPVASGDPGRRIAVKSSRLSLPRLTLTPRIKLRGILGRLLDRFTEHVVSREMPKVRFEHPGFDEKYFLVSADPERAKTLFGDEVLDWLANSRQHFYMAGENDLFVFTRVEHNVARPPRTSAEPSPEIVRRVIDDAGRLVELLTQRQDSPARSALSR